MPKNDLNYKVYFEERKSLIDAKREGSRLFDKAILTLAAGAFGLSLTFIKEIVPCVKSGTMFMLAGAWIGFCISILSTLISFLTSQSACRKQIEILDGEHFDDKILCDSSQYTRTCPTNKLAICTRWLNRLSILAFIVGVIFLALFSFGNLSSYKEVVMSDNTNEKLGKDIKYERTVGKTDTARGYDPDNPLPTKRKKPNGKK